MSDTQTAAARPAKSTPVRANEESTTRALDAAIAPLRHYGAGSNRADLVPLDEAVRRVAVDPALRTALEASLVAILQSSAASALAKEYICGKLGLIGGARATAALGALLADAEVGDAARRALEAMPCPEAVAALRREVVRLHADQQVGVVNSLGRRRDTGSVALLVRLLGDRDVRVAAAAAAALGEIGSEKAAQGLGKIRTRATGPLGAAWADACLVCAERLAAEGRGKEARRVYTWLADSPQPPHVRQAAERGLQGLRAAPRP